MTLSEQITYSTVLIKCKYKDGTTGFGTGFIANLCDTGENGRFVPVIITNSHVIKDSIQTEFEFCGADENGNPQDTVAYLIKYSKDKNHWIHHPDPSVDLCCLTLAELLYEFENSKTRVYFTHVDTKIIPSREKLLELSALEDIVMVGYPIGISDSYNHKPVIRKGITASHPAKDYQGKKETLLDIAAFPGSSGSPVFLLNESAISTSTGMRFNRQILLLGVLYGGPVFNAQGFLTLASLPNMPVPVTGVPANLGVMIKAERIIEFEPLLKELAEKAEKTREN